MQTIRPAAVAEMFYPGDAAVLQASIDEMLAGAPAPGGLLPKAIIVPHAGYVYSGSVAAPAYRLVAELRSSVRRVVLVGPAHRVAVRGLALPTVDAFATPLGTIPIDQEACAAIAGLPQVVSNDAAHAEEHALEVQLPFLQSVLGAFSLVPLVVGAATTAEVAEVLERLWGGDETLIVISSDLSHFLPYDAAREVDVKTVDKMLRLDATIDHERACGGTPVNGLLAVAKARGLSPKLLDLRNSGDTAGDRSRVVGYCSIYFSPGQADA
jgi:AmmeMemoRadiSam system protein B